MNKQIESFIALIVLIFVITACAGNSLQMPHIKLDTAKNDTGSSPSQTFKINEKIYAVAIVTNSSSSKLQIKVMDGDSEITRTTIQFKNGKPAPYEFTMPKAGSYKVVASLRTDSGKDLISTSQYIEVKNN